MGLPSKGSASGTIVLSQRVTTRLIHQRKTTDNIFGPNRFGICLYSDQGNNNNKKCTKIMVVAIVVYNSLYETLY